MGENPYEKDANGEEERGVETPLEEKTAESAPTEEKKRSKNPYVNGNSPVDVKAEQKRTRTAHYISAIAIALCTFLFGLLIGQAFIDPEMRTLMRVKNKIQKEYYKEITDEAFYDAVYKTINESLLDEYSHYMSAEEYSEATAEGKGKRSGLGLVFRTADAAGAPQMYITRVCGNSPAENAQIRDGGYLTGFGDSETAITESVVFDEFAAYLEEKEDDETFYVRIQTDGESKMYPLRKSEYVESYAFYRSNATAYGFGGKDATEQQVKGEPLAFLPDDTAYIRLVQFNGAAATEFASLMKVFQQENKKHLLLDLRGNGGGYLDIMLKIASYFCKNTTDGKPVVAIADYGDHRESFSASGNAYDDYFSEDSRICVLADNATASASECLIGCMLDYGTISYGDICLLERSGVAKTYGKGIMQTTYPLVLGGGAVKLTTAEILWPKGNCINGRGILPADGALTATENDNSEAEISSAWQTLFASTAKSERNGEIGVL